MGPHLPRQNRIINLASHLENPSSNSPSRFQHQCNEMTGLPSSDIMMMAHVQFCGKRSEARGPLVTTFTPVKRSECSMSALTDDQLELLEHLHADSSILNSQQQELIRRYSMRSSTGVSPAPREKVALFQRRSSNIDHFSYFDHQP